MSTSTLSILSALRRPHPCPAPSAPLRRLHSHSPFDATFLHPRQANHVPLSPISFLKRSIDVFPNRLAGVHGNDHTFRLTWNELGARVSRLATGLHSSFKLKEKDVVSVMSSNTPEAYESHFAVPGSGLILHSINTRLDAPTIAYQLKHSKSRIVMVDTEYNNVMNEVKNLLEAERHPLPNFVAIHDPGYDDREDEPPGLYAMTYEDLLNAGSPSWELQLPKDEFDAIALNYTAGAAGDTKGVVTHHRGAYLKAISNIMECDMPRFSKYLWIVPMFHCNGWCFPWTVAALSGTNFFLRKVRPAIIFDLISRYGIEYMGGAPIVMNMLLDSPDRIKFLHDVKMWAAGSHTPSTIIKRMKEELNVHIQTAYGLTEVYGPVTTFTPSNSEDKREMEVLKTVNKPMVLARDTLMEEVRVVDPKTYEPVPDDGQTLGEVMMRGNMVMKGYLDNPSATEQCFENGWFHTGDIAVSHGQGRFELKGRSKDIIISGGETISSIEVENIIHNHPDVREVAVVAMPHDKWGEVPAAFVSVAANSKARNEETLIAWCRDNMPHYMAPKKIIFMDNLPKTGAGRIHKTQLREQLPSITNHD